MAKIIKFADVIKNPQPPTTNTLSLLNNYVRCLSDIDQMIEDHFKKISCP